MNRGAAPRDRVLTTEDRATKFLNGTLIQNGVCFLCEFDFGPANVDNEHNFQVHYKFKHQKVWESLLDHFQGSTVIPEQKRETVPPAPAVAQANISADDEHIKNGRCTLCRVQIQGNDDMHKLINLHVSGRGHQLVVKLIDEARQFVVKGMCTLCDVKVCMSDANIREHVCGNNHQSNFKAKYPLWESNVRDAPKHAQPSVPLFEKSAQSAAHARANEPKANNESSSQQPFSHPKFSAQSVNASFFPPKTESQSRADASRHSINQSVNQANNRQAFQSQPSVQPSVQSAPPKAQPTPKVQPTAAQSYQQQPKPQPQHTAPKHQPAPKVQPSQSYQEQPKPAPKPQSAPKVQPAHPRINPFDILGSSPDEPPVSDSSPSSSPSKSQSQSCTQTNYQPKAQSQPNVQSNPKHQPAQKNKQQPKAQPQPSSQSAPKPQSAPKAQPSSNGKHQPYEQPQTNGTSAPKAQSSSANNQPPKEQLKPVVMTEKEVEQLALAEQKKTTGNARYSSGAFREAVELFTEALDLLPSSAKPSFRAVYLSNRSAARSSLQEYELSLADARLSIQADPSFSKAYSRAARCAINLGRFAEARTLLSQSPSASSAVELAEIDKYESLQNLARKAIDEGQPSSVLAHLIPILEAFPRNVIAHELKARALIDDQQFDDAEKLIDSLNNSFPNDATMMLLRARLLYAKHSHELAIKQCEDILKAHPKHPATVKLRNLIRDMDATKLKANTLYTDGKVGKAIAQYTKCLQFDPSNDDYNAKILANRAASYIKLRDWKHAVSDCDASMMLDSTNIKVVRRLAQCHRMLSNWPECVHFTELAIKMCDDDEKDELRRQLDEVMREQETAKPRRKNYYTVMGLTKATFTEEKLQRAYRTLAMRWHPDKNEGSTLAESKFKEINEANQILKDPHTRRLHDKGISARDMDDYDEDYDSDDDDGSDYDYEDDFMYEFMFQHFMRSHYHHHH